MLIHSVNPVMLIADYGVPLRIPFEFKNVQLWGNVQLSSFLFSYWIMRSAPSPEGRVQIQRRLYISSEASFTVSLQCAPLVDSTKKTNFILHVETIVKRAFSHHPRMKVITMIGRQQSLNKLKASLKFFHIHI